MSELTHEQAQKQGQEFATNITAAIMLKETAISLANEISKGNCNWKYAHELADKARTLSSSLQLYCAKRLQEN